MFSRTWRACAGALLCVVSLFAEAASGDWDRAFGVDGRLMLNAGRTFTVIAWEPQADGKIVVAGHPDTTAYLVARFNADGTLDSTFDGDGILSFPFGTHVFGHLDLKSLPDGRLLFAARADDHVKLLRLNADGSPDTSFGVNGEFQLTSPRSVQKPHLAIAPDGAAIIAASLSNGATDPSIVVARVLTNGTLDPAFGTAGMVEVGSPAPDKEARAVTVQPNGAIVIGGTLGSTSNPEPFVARVTSIGQIDSSFGTNGVVPLSFLQRYGYVDRVVATADGKILAGGMARDLNGALPNFVARLDANGDLDPSFGSAGRVILSGVMQSILLEPSGKLVTAGFVNDLAPALAWLARYNTDGSPDVSFGLRGRARADFSLGASRLRVIDTQIKRAADGSYRALLGIAADSGPASYAMARFVESGPAPAVIGLRSGVEAAILSQTLKVAEGFPRQVSIYRTGGTEGAVSVQYRLVGQSAQAGQDFVAANGTLTFHEGETSKPLELEFIDDSARESPETLYLELFAPTDGAVLSRSRLNIEIVSDSGDVGTSGIFLTNSAQATESAGSVRLLIQRTGDMRTPLAINYTTVAGTANAGADFTAASGTVSWAANEGGTRSVDIAIVNDAVVEVEEQFSVTLSTSSAGAMVGQDAVIRISDNDNATASPTLSFKTTMVTVSESASAVTLEVQRLGNPTQAVSATWSTGSSFVGALATSNVDYTQANGVLSWGAGDVAPKTFTVPILQDAASETVELFAVNIVAASPASNLSGGGTVNVAILDDEPAPSQPIISIGPGMSVDESVGIAYVPLTLSGIPANTVSVRYVIRTESATNADVLVTSGIITYYAGNTGPQQVPIEITDDTLDEINETFNVMLVPMEGGALIGTTSAQITILDNDPTPAGQNPPVPPGIQLSASAISVGESERAARLTVTRMGGEPEVKFTVTGVTASEPADFIAASGSLIWGNGEPASKTFEVQINGDVLAESDETFDVVFTSAVGTLQLPTATARVTIVDDDEPGSWPAQVDFFSASQAVGESAASVTLHVARSGNTTVATSVDYTTVAGTATTDFAATSGTLTWAANDSSVKLITIPLVPDAEDEADESFSVQLRNAASGTELGVASSTVTIVDDDAPGTNPNPPTPNPPTPNPPTPNPPTPNPPSPDPNPSTPTPAPSGGGGGGGEESLITLLLWAALVSARRFGKISDGRDSRRQRVHFGAAGRTNKK